MECGYCALDVSMGVTKVEQKECLEKKLFNLVLLFGDSYLVFLYGEFYVLFVV